MIRWSSRGIRFAAALADELANNARFKEFFSAAEPALLLNGSVQAGSGKNARRATGISIVGAEPEFWSLGSGGPAKALAADEVAITEPVARELDVESGDGVLLRVPIASAIPADSTLGEKSETSQSRTMKIGAVLPAEGIARFGVVPSQQLPRTVFVPLAALQQLLKQPGKANAILVATGEVASAADADAQLALEQALRPTLEDYGVKVEGGAAPAKYLQIAADQLVLPNEVVRAAEKAIRTHGRATSCDVSGEHDQLGRGRDAAKDSVFDDHGCGFDAAVGTTIR